MIKWRQQRAKVHPWVLRRIVLYAWYGMVPPEFACRVRASWSVCTLYPGTDSGALDAWMCTSHLGHMSPRLREGSCLDTLDMLCAKS
jgi:hypothetical protein